MEMKLRLGILLLAMAVVAHSSSSIGGHDWALSHVSYASSHAAGSFGEQIGDEDEMLLDSEGCPRKLYGEDKYLSYDALRRNAIPCGRRGNSYYNCHKRRERLNPYRRGCSAITRCARFTD